MAQKKTTYQHFIISLCSRHILSIIILIIIVRWSIPTSTNSLYKLALSWIIALYLNPDDQSPNTTWVQLKRLICIQTIIFIRNSPTARLYHQHNSACQYRNSKDEQSFNHHHGSGAGPAHWRMPGRQDRAHSHREEEEPWPRAWPVGDTQDWTKLKKKKSIIPWYWLSCHYRWKKRLLK